MSRVPTLTRHRARLRLLLLAVMYGAVALLTAGCRVSASDPKAEAPPPLKLKHMEDRDVFEVDGAAVREHTAVIIDGSRIADLVPAATLSPGVSIHNLPEGAWLAPGFIDLQVNGYAGVDYNSADASQEEIAFSIRAMFASGVTRFFPTVITGSFENMSAALANLAGAREAIAEGLAMEAFHVEGPYISPGDGPRGAHPARWVRPPDIDEFFRFQDAARGNIRIAQ